MTISAKSDNSAQTDNEGVKPGAREVTIKFLRILGINRVAARLYYRYIHGFDSAQKEVSAVVHRCFRHAVKTGIAEKGDYFEFGVFKGHTLWQAQVAATDQKLDNFRFFGFDSFAGLPPIGGVDNVENAPFYEGQYAWPLEKVTEELTKRGADWSRCSLIQGFFEDTLTRETEKEFEIGKASIVLLDCDLYESASVALEFLHDKFVNGSILIMDDWNAFNADNARGERLALAEFKENHPEWNADPWFPYGEYGQVFIMRRVESPGSD